MRTAITRLAGWGAIGALALAVLPLLARNLLAIPAHIALDPNEGWNAVHALRAMHMLYPPPGAWLVNNYPPLSFYAVAAIKPLTGDPVIAGRLLAALSFGVLCLGLGLVARALGARMQAALLAVLFFAAVLLIGSDYVAMDDPQMLGHAVQAAALLLLVRGQVTMATLLFALGVFVKHNLLALPVAAGLWLCTQDRRAGLRFITMGLVWCGLGLIAVRVGTGTSLLAQLASPRLSSLGNVWSAVRGLWWVPLPALALFGLRAPARVFVLLYAGLALILGLVFSAGDGVDANVFFDLALALSLALALTPWRTIAAACALPPLIVLAMTFHDNNFVFTRAFAGESSRDIAFLKAVPGPALCDQLSLCLWAGKPAQLDVFNIGEAIKTGARDPAPLVARIVAHDFAVIQLEDPDALGPAVRAAIEKNYRVDHSGDNGAFWVAL